MIQLNYFSKSKNGICGSDFENKIQTDSVNENYILSISNIKKFCLPLSGKFVDNYFTVTMGNGDIYYLKENEYVNLRNF